MSPVILLIDDNEDILDFLSADLADKYTVITSTNAKDALEILNKETVHLVINDVMMPGMDGFQLCKHIKTNVDYSHIPVILLTAKNTLQSKIEGLEHGADAYIEKPFSLEYLHVQISTLLINRNKVKEYFANSPLAHIKSMAHSKADEEFLEQLNNLIRENMENPDLDVEHLARKMNMSRPTFYRKIKVVSDLTPNELINLARLKRAAELLSEGHHKIYEVAEMVGYNSQTNFGRSFLKQFGITPRDYLNLKQLKNKNE